ncbi:MAG: hypothetical protein ROW52_01285 [Anaerolineaceae bacterium]|jgi:hypothetical protein
MAQIQQKRKAPGKPAAEVYQSVIQAAPKAGLQVWKRRDIAWLAMVRSGASSDAVNGNVSVKPGAEVTIALTGPDEADLMRRAAIIFSEIGAQE